MQAHARAMYPDECCGIVVERAGREEVVRISNIQNRQHASHPVQFPRTARIAYTMAPAELFRVLADEKDGKLRLRAFYHSHPDHDAYFSAQDKQQALSWDEPNYPDAVHVVMSVRDGQVGAAKAFAWDTGLRDFVEIALVIRP